ncbi:MAG: HPr family phosphocarrier protein [Gammaproteobacteria bacterium]|nr:HPr family phosphocarrier protein [Gammaproteobacteria bacterium]
MPTTTLTIINRLGLHARAAAKFVQTAGHYGCTVLVRRNGREVNGKSIMGVMMLAAGQGAEIEICTEGDDADAALAALAALIDDRFGEPS